MLTLRKKSSKRAPAKRTETRNDTLGGDVTIDDFANATKTHARIKKAVANVLEVEQDVPVEKESLNSWNELDNNQEDNMDKATNSVSSSQRRSRKGKSEEETCESEGVDYPLDVWFLISEYITPEGVGRFARICKNSYYVTTTGKFWFHLYKYCDRLFSPRTEYPIHNGFCDLSLSLYYELKTFCIVSTAELSSLKTNFKWLRSGALQCKGYVAGLPERLQPQCMVRTHGLRACVIRTLHYTYFPFKRGLDDASSLRQEHPHSLSRRQCCLMWHKLREVPVKKSNALTKRSEIHSKKSEFLETWKDVAVNPEEGCKVLRVTCQKYCMLPPVIGLILQTVSLNLMPGFKDHRLQLGFGTSTLPNTLTTQVILTDVMDYKILDWWSPHYPHEDEIRKIELPQSVSWD